MKKLFLAGVTTVAFAAGTSSYAADIRPVYKAPPPIIPVCANFGGFYVGAHAGVATHEWNYHDRDRGIVFNLLGAPEHVSASENGWGGGLQAGFNWQRGCAVFGFEADWTWTDSDSQRDFGGHGLGGALAGVIAPFNNTVTVDNKWFGTFRTRTGVVVSDLMLYVTGGLAYKRSEWSVNQCCLAIPIAGLNFGGDFFQEENTRWGWTVGVGAEWSLWNNWSIKSEVLYAQFEQREFNFNSPTLAAINAAIGANVFNTARRFDFDDNVWIGRIGVNWRFGGGPIIARY